MIAKAIEKILQLAPPNLIPIRDRMFSDRQLFAQLEPVPDPLTVTTLAGFAGVHKQRGRVA